MDKKIINFGFIAHIDAGKTTTTERVLYHTGANYKIGEVDEGTTVTDWMIEEKERGITITSATVSCEWKDSMLHIIDTPGHVDFTAEVHRSLRVLDSAIVILCSVNGVQTQTETVCRQAEYFSLPLVFYINKLDREGADYLKTFNDIKDKLSLNPIPITLPYYIDDNLSGIIDLIHKKIYKFDDKGKISATLDIENDDKYSMVYEIFIDRLTEYAPALTEKALEETLSAEDILPELKKAMIDRKLQPVMAGSSYKNIGIPVLLDYITELLPEPGEAVPVKAFDKQHKSETIIEHSTENPALLYVFKVQYHRERGLLSYTRIYRGQIEVQDTLFNPQTGNTEHIHQMYYMFGDRLTPIKTAEAGDIVVLGGLKNVTTGDTLSAGDNQYIIERLRFPEPVVFMKVEVCDASMQNLFRESLDKIMPEDPTITYKEDTETGEILIGGMGELHLQIFLERMKNEYKLKLKSGNPIVAKRETISSIKEGSYTFDMKLHGSSFHIVTDIKIEPVMRHKGNIIDIKCEGLDDNDLQSLREGINESLISGPETAYPVTDIKVTVKKVTGYEKGLSPDALKASTHQAMFKILRECDIIVMEPVIKLNIQSGPEFNGAIINDLQSRKGVVLDVISDGLNDLIKGELPLRNLFGYATDLRSLTHGKGNFTQEFARYDVI